MVKYFQNSEDPQLKKAMSLKQYLDDYWFPLDIDNGENKPTTISFYKSMRRYILECFEDVELQSITSTDVELCLKYFRCERKVKSKKGMAPKTVRHIYAALKMVLDSAKRRKFISENPVDFVRPPKVPKKPVNVLSDEEVEQSLAALPNYPIEDRCMLELFLFTGMRRGELAGLQWGDIDFDNDQLYIERNVTRSTGNGVVVDTPKTDRSRRTIPLTTKVSAELNEYKNMVQSNAPNEDLSNAYLFYRRDDLFSPREPTYITWKVRNFAEKNNLSPSSPHKLRRTFATQALSHGMNIKGIQDILGHSDASTTLDYYVGIDMKQKRKIVDKLSEIYNM